MHTRGESGKQNYCLPVELIPHFLAPLYKSSFSDHVFACRVLLVNFIGMIFHVYTWKPEGHVENPGITKNVYSVWDEGQKYFQRIFVS